MEKIRKEDIAQLRFLSGILLSPDKKQAVCTITESDLKKNSYRKDLYLFKRDCNELLRMTWSGNNAGAVWDDSGTLLFSSERKEEDKAKDTEEKTVFYRLNIHGGEAREAFTVRKDVLGIRKIKDGVYAMLVDTDWNKPDPETTDKEICLEEQDYHIFEEVPFWANNEGYVSGRRSALFIYREEDGSLTRLTERTEGVSSFDVQPERILWISRTYDGLIPLTSQLKLYDAETGETMVIAEDLRIDDAVFAGSTIVYAASDMEIWGSGKQPDLYRYDLQSGRTMKWVNEEELTIGSIPMTDSTYGSGRSFLSSGETVWLKVLKGYRNEIMCFTPENTLETAVSFNGAVFCFDTDGKELIACAAEADSLGSLWTGETELTKAIDPNEDYIKTHWIAHAEYIPFVDSDGVRIDGWILKPEGFDETDSVPGILEIHGGPRAAYGELFFHEMQQFVGEGYAVFYCNPRGGEGYGEAFADLRGKYGTIDYRDLMEFTDHVLKLFPKIDVNRLGAAGGSYGGFMCNWIEGHTGRFAAIASQRSIANWVSDFGVSEIGVSFDGEEMAATPWTDMEKMWRQSPLKYADQAKTPILFIHSLCDYNVTIDQGLEMFTAMKYFGVPSRMVVFEGETHSLSRIGKPKHRIRRLKEMNDWFERWLKK
ncbi:MAG: S9 family peptidase [Solobacterium sp.]|nr:S9 family peptidase [Solobacterium sp.]